MKDMHLLMSVFIFVSEWTMNQFHKSETQIVKQSVKGDSVSAVTPSPSMIPTILPEAPQRRVFHVSSPTPPQRIAGGWYWRSELGKSQRWLGTDKEGKDIWTDTGDPTSTPSPTQQIQSNSNSYTPQSSQDSSNTLGVGVQVSVQNIRVTKK